MIIISNHLFIWQGKKPDLAIPLFVNFSRVSNVHNLNFPGIINKGCILSKLSHVKARYCRYSGYQPGTYLLFTFFVNDNFLREWCQTFGDAVSWACTEWLNDGQPGHRSDTVAARPEIRNRTSLFSNFFWTIYFWKQNNKCRGVSGGFLDIFPLSTKMGWGSQFIITDPVFCIHILVSPGLPNYNTESKVLWGQ